MSQKSELSIFKNHANSLATIHTTKSGSGMGKTQQHGIRRGSEIALWYKITPYSVYFIPTSTSQPHFLLMKNQCNSFFPRTINSAIAFSLLLRSVSWHSSCPVCLYTSKSFGRTTTTNRLFSYKLYFLHLTHLNGAVQLLLQQQKGHGLRIWGKESTPGSCKNYQQAKNCDRAEEP